MSNFCQRIGSKIRRTSQPAPVDGYSMQIQEQIISTNRPYGGERNHSATVEVVQGTDHPGHLVRLEPVVNHLSILAHTDQVLMLQLGQML